MRSGSPRDVAYVRYFRRADTITILSAKPFHHLDLKITLGEQLFQAITLTFSLKSGPIRNGKSGYFN